MSIAKKKLARCVIVNWIDAHALSDSWGKFEKKDHKPRPVTSVGWVLQDDEVGISITQSVDTEGHDDHSLFVPAVNVTSIREIHIP
jgi:hypothetical protein